MERSLVYLVFALGLAVGFPTSASAGPPGPSDWPMYGHDLHRTFYGVTSLTPETVSALAPAWFFPTGDAVSANPIIVNGVVYVGSWNGFFYAIDAQTGKERWHYKVKPQPAVHPPTSNAPKRNGRLQRYPQDLQSFHPQPLLGALQSGNAPSPLSEIVADTTSDGGIITSSAFFYPGNGKTHGRDVVIFGAGYTLYALYADDGSEFFPPHDYPGSGCATTNANGDCLPAGDPMTDEARIFSSPAVVSNRILFSVDADGQGGHRGYLVSSNLERGDPNWIRELDTVDTAGNVLNDGCGNVWASPTVIDIAKDPSHPSGQRMAVEIVGVADCRFTNPGLHEKVLSVDINTGNITWIFDPAREDPNCDWDFGPTANYGTDPMGLPFLGVGAKDGTYYRLNPDTGKLIWKKRVVFGGFAGGFIGSTAFDGTRIYGATALGDFGRFEGFGEPSLGCRNPGINQDMTPRSSVNPSDLLIQEPSMHAFEASSDTKQGAVAWQGLLSQSFGSTTAAASMVFVGTALTRGIQIRDAGSGKLLRVIPLAAPSNSGVIPSGDAVYFGTGSSEQGVPAGVYKLTPLGR
jgi:outer membrane protein assembly factor BamB